MAIKLIDRSTDQSEIDGSRKSELGLGFGIATDRGDPTQRVTGKKPASLERPMPQHLVCRDSVGQEKSGRGGAWQESSGPKF